MRLHKQFQKKLFKFKQSNGARKGSSWLKAETPKSQSESPEKCD